jgi:hypothetical protein
MTLTRAGHSPCLKRTDEDAAPGSRDQDTRGRLHLLRHFGATFGRLGRNAASWSDISALKAKCGFGGRSDRKSALRSPARKEFGKIVYFPFDVPIAEYHSI